MKVSWMKAVRRFMLVFAFELMSIVAYGHTSAQSPQDSQTTNQKDTPFVGHPIDEKSVGKGCAEQALEDAIRNGEKIGSTECNTLTAADENSPMGIVFSGSNEKCVLAPYGYVCTKADYGVYSPNDNKPNIVRLNTVYVIRTRLDPNFSCNWSTEARVTSNGVLVLQGGTPIQYNCGTRNVATYSSGNDVKRGSVACGKFLENNVVQAEACTVISP
ncbi:hypothetical protein [Herpetosiphon gulosus]|uniref:Secreted protein n=1 Tax=Herpetosiphon gulosus TaxID=1973496 RepID=A0ABP9X4L1_9CHLR